MLLFNLFDDWKAVSVMILLVIPARSLVSTSWRLLFAITSVTDLILDRNMMRLMMFGSLAKVS